LVRPGIAALRQVAGFGDKRVTVGTVGFSLAPRINASGRLERADAAFRLLTTEDPDEARTLAAALDTVNRERQAVEERIWSEARQICLQADLAKTGAFVLSSEEWHPGVIGIVASRIVDEFYRPAVLISVKDGVGKGSARSIPGFDLYEGLSRCSDLLLGFGGHKYAAGLSVAEKTIPDLRERLSGLVLDHFGDQGFVRAITIDAPVSFKELTFDLLRDIERIAPFGQGNPEPRLGAKGLEVTSLRPVGNNKHLKMRLREQNGAFFDAIAYNKAEAFVSRLRFGSVVAAVFIPRFNTWNGNTSIELEIKDIKVER
jgi:single-stranded-DNA-specific exonuclease